MTNHNKKEMIATCFYVVVVKTFLLHVHQWFADDIGLPHTFVMAA
jgi:hypothetical protein